MGRAKPLPQAAGAMLHGDGRSGVCREVGPLTGSVAKLLFREFWHL